MFEPNLNINVFYSAFKMLTRALKIYYSFLVYNYQIIEFIILREISKEISLQREVFNFPIYFFII